MPRVHAYMEVGGRQRLEHAVDNTASASIERDNMGEDIWMKLGWAILLGAMLVMIWPRARIMMQEGKKGTAAEWKSALLPLLLVAGFVILLILSV